MTPMRIAAGAGEAQAMPGRSRTPLGGTDAGFGAILSDVVPHETPGSPATGRAKEPGRTPATSAGEPASTLTAPLRVEALLARLAGPTPPGTPSDSATKTPTVPKKHGDESEPARDPGEPAAPDVVTAALAVATIAAPVIAAQMVSLPAPHGDDPQTASQPNGKAAPSALPVLPTTVETKPALSATAAGGSDEAVAQTIASAPVALLEVARHLSPARTALAAARSLPEAPSADPTSDGGAVKATVATGPAPVEAVSADADGHDAPADRKVADASPILAAEALETAGGQPLRQITDAVTALAADRPAEPGAAAQIPAETATARPSPTRSLILHLAPAALGTVTVRLHLTEAGLSLRLAVTNPTTLGLISHARGSLEQAIGATYKLDQLVIQGADVAPPQRAGSHDATRSDGGALADQQAGNQRGGEEASRRPARPMPAREAVAAGAGRAGGLFL